MNAPGESRFEVLLRDRRLGAALVLYAALALCWLQLRPQGGLLERDGYFHARYAQMLPEFGLSRTFDWTKASTWDGRFCDKEFLFHGLMVPFTRNAAEPVNGARVFLALLDAGILAALYFVLRRQKVPGAALFPLLLLCLGGPAVLRLLLIRSHVLSILLLVAGLGLMMEKRWKALAVLGFVFSWSYTFPLVLVMTAVPFAAGRWFGGGGLDWRSPLAAFGGVAAGLAVHPYSPHTMELFLTILDIVRGGLQGSGASMTLGAEIHPLSTRDFLLGMPMFVGLWMTIALCGWGLGKRVAAETMGALCAALFWLGMSMVFFRFVEYGAPLAALAAGMVFRDAWPGLRLHLASVRARAVAGGLAVALLAAHLWAMHYAAEVTAALDPPRYRGAAAWMARNLGEGETVVNLWWDDFPDLYYDGARQRFLWGIDPNFTQRWDPEVAGKLEAMRDQKTPLDARWLAETFHSRVMVLAHSLALRYPVLTTDAWKPVYVDASAVVFALTGPEGPPERMPADALRIADPDHAFRPTDRALTGDPKTEK
ncbi:MAG: hypothetical protein L6R28_10940 [Planctomycetes bacterium]|nr:hypothetical protein [Planctomycetota bacterium]